MRKKKKRRMSKIFIYAALTALFAGLGVYLAIKQNPKKNIGPSTKQGGQNVERVEISGVKVKDFLKDVEPDSNYVRIDQTPDYHIFYIPDQELFIISITSYPFDEHRPVAEKKLLERLVINESEACKLNVEITTPSFANPDKAGKSYRLSFCK